MNQFTVITGMSAIGENERGFPLIIFLRTFVGDDQVRVESPDSLLRAEPFSTQFLFLFFPTAVDEKSLSKIQYRTLILADYFDDLLPVAQATTFQHLTRRYFKFTVDRSVEYDWQIGLLPINLSPQFYAGLRFFQSNLGSRRWDAMFLGAATGRIDGRCQRIDWLRQIHGIRDQITFFGGLIPNPDDGPREALIQFDTDIDTLIYSGKPVSQPHFLWHMMRSKMALLPRGNCRWTYRHYEALLCRSIPISTDVSTISMLIDFPTDHMVLVDDNQNVADVVQTVLDNLHDYPSLLDYNLNYINQFLWNGSYSIKKPAIFEKFMEQL